MRIKPASSSAAGAGSAHHRVVITGAGCITPLGQTIAEVWSRLLRGESAINAVSYFPADSFRTNFAAEVKDFELSRFLADVEPHRNAQRNTHFALAAAATAWKHAGLGDLAAGPVTAADIAADSRRVGMYLGAGEGILDFENYAHTNIAGWNAAERQFDCSRWAEAAYQLLEATIVEQEPDMVLAHLARAFPARGPSLNCMTACAASTQAIGEAFEIISRGDADIMISGGTHSMIHPLGMTGFIRLTAMSTRRDDPQAAARPFDLTRDGFVMGEGAGIVILERLEHALARGAAPLAEVVGYGSSADAYRITDIQPDGLGAGFAMRRALTEAGIDPQALDEQGRPLVHYISAHGTGTQENDKIESRAVKDVFGAAAAKVPMSSVKSMMGHLIQAAGAVELIICLQAIRSGFVPPTINLNTPDPACDLDYVPRQARDLQDQGGVEVAISNSFGFGGQNDALAIRRYRE